MNKKVIIYIRKWGNLVDWDKEIDNETLASCSPSPLRELRLKFLNKWNNYFGLTFCQYRYGLQQIAESTLKNVKNVNYIVKGWQDLHNILAEDDNYIILPIDDDDWFHPDAALYAIKNDTHICYWNCGFYNLGIERRSTIKMRNKCRVVCFSNGYAIDGKLFNSYSIKAFKRLCDRHMSVHKTIINPNKFQHIDRYLGIKVQNISSTHFLKKNPDLINIENYLDKISTGSFDNSVFDWAFCHIQELELLNETLLDSIK